MSLRRAALVGSVAAVWLIGGAAPALADPAGPTDYRTEVVGIDPDPGGFTIDVIGGDAFIALTTDAGRTIEVVGYRGEPYLRFLPDGTVVENRNAPTTYLNIDRYAEVDIPDTATPEAVPEWQQVASDGSYAWHDHRAHWMNPARPPGRAAGDVILEGVVPLIVDGVEVDVAVISTWQDSPSPAPAAAGAVLGASAGAALWLWGTRRTAAWLTLAGGVAATVAGIAATLSVPAETGPAWSLWAPPAAAAVLGGLTLLPRLAGRASTLLLLAAALLVTWGVLHREWMTRAILPTDLPFWVDRSVTALALAGGAGLAVYAVRATIRGATAPSP